MEGDTSAADGRKELRGSGPLLGFSRKTPTDGKTVQNVAVCWIEVSRVWRKD